MGIQPIACVHNACEIMIVLIPVYANSLFRQMKERQADKFGLRCIIVGAVEHGAWLLHPTGVGLCAGVG
jgi:hypothetical protein